MMERKDWICPYCNENLEFFGAKHDPGCPCMERKPNACEMPNPHNGEVRACPSCGDLRCEFHHRTHPWSDMTPWEAFWYAVWSGISDFQRYRQHRWKNWRRVQ